MTESYKDFLSDFRAGPEGSRPKSYLKIITIVMLFAGPLHAKKAAKIMEWKGQYGGPLEAGAEIADNARAWTRLWRTLGQDAPPFDFKTHFAVAVFAGERMTGGYAIEFLEPAPKGSGLTVRYRVKPPSGFSTQAIARPWKVRAFPRVKGKVSVSSVPAEDKPK